VVPDDLWALRLPWPGIVGGVNSRGEHDPQDGFSGANISYRIGQKPELVAHHRHLLMASLGTADWPVVCAEQVHGNRVAVVDAGDLSTLQSCAAGHVVKQTDGLVTRTPGLLLNLVFADCVPIFLYCSQPLTIGVLHAGWRGTAAQIARRGVEAMVESGAAVRDLQAIIGPAICGNCYEVGPEVVEAMAHLSGVCKSMRDTGRYRVDLPEINRMSLIAAGVCPESIQTSSLCTRCGPIPLFSYRGSGGKTGLHGGFIGIQPHPQDTSPSASC
jgi:YfiH family protein